MSFRASHWWLGSLLAVTAFSAVPAAAQLAAPDTARWHLLDTEAQSGYLAMAVVGTTVHAADDPWHQVLSSILSVRTGVTRWVERRAPEHVGDRNLLWLLFDFDSTAAAPVGEAHRRVARELALMQFDCSLDQSVNVGIVLLDQYGDPIRRLTYDRNAARDLWDYTGSTLSSVILKHACG
ncbi:MAG TPA: hypothetical protein VGM77_09400 [Gemmatimonadales bacterium]|jgi:hypothetical protein